MLPTYISIPLADLLAKNATFADDKERGEWLRSFICHICTGSGGDEFAKEVLDNSLRLMLNNRERQRRFQEKKREAKQEEKEAKAPEPAKKESAKTPKKAEVPRNAYGSLNNVMLSEDERKKMYEYIYDGVRPSRQDWLNLIEELSAWKARGHTTKSDYSTLLSWFQRRVKEDKERKNNAPKSFFEMRQDAIKNTFADVIEMSKLR